MRVLQTMVYEFCNVYYQSNRLFRNQPLLSLLSTFIDDIIV
jgi:hypothetical protein